MSYWSYLKLHRNTQGRGDTLNKRDGTSYYEKICLRGDRAVAGCRVSCVHCTATSFVVLTNFVLLKIMFLYRKNWELMVWIFNL